MGERSIEGLLATQFRIDDDGIGWIRLNRPTAGNSRNQQMRAELGAIYEFVDRSDDVRVVVLTASGDRFFCTGMDLREADAGEGAQQRRERLRSSRDIEALAALGVPTIAAVNGYALGGGLEMALACDLRIVAEHAQLGLPELVHGLVPGGGGTQRLPRLIGMAATFELLYLARRLSAAEAVRIGLAMESVPLAHLESRAGEVARSIAERPASAVRAAKRLVLASADLGLAEGIARELDALLALLDARDAGQARDRDHDLHVRREPGEALR